MFPSLLCEVSDPPIGDDDPLCEQQGALRKQISPVTTELAAGRNDAMAGHRRIARGAHDVTDGAMGARATGGGGDITISGHAAVRNAADDMSGLALAKSELRTIGRLEDW